MPKIERKGDPNSGGGIITTIPQSTVFANDRLISVVGSKGTGHGVGKHAAMVWSTTNGGATVEIEGRVVNRVGDVDTCGHVRVGGSADVEVG